MSEHRRQGLNGLVLAASLVIVMSGISLAGRVVVPFMLASFLAILSAPLVRMLVVRKLPRPLATLLVVFGQLGFLIGLSLLITSSLNSLTEQLPKYQQLSLELINDVLTWLRSHGVEVDTQQVTELIDPGSVFRLTSGVLSGFAGVASSTLIVLLFSTFMLLEAPSLQSKFERILERSSIEIDDDPIGQTSTQVQQYLGVKTATSLTTGALAGVYVWAWDLEFALFWGLSAFLLNYIPTVGSIIAAIPPVLVALLLLGLGPAIGVMVGYFVINMVIGNIIEPRLMGATLGLSPTVILLSLLFWGWLLGPVGALLSAPLTMIVKILCEHIDEWAWAADLLDSPRNFDAPFMDPPAQDTDDGT